MNGDIRSEAHAVTCVQQFTELVGIGDNIASLADRDPAAPVLLHELALHDGSVPFLRIEGGAARLSRAAASIATGLPGDSLLVRQVAY